MIKTQIQWINDDWKEVKNVCRSTINKEATDNEPDKEFKLKLLLSEHSPIRLIRVKWRWEGIKSWIAGHFVRHHIGVEKWVSTQRSDRTGVDRHNLSQDSPVSLEMVANAQSLINMARYRLCYQAAPETREQMEDLKQSIKESGREELAFMMQPNCIYRCGCPEPKSCGFWNDFVKHCDNTIHLADIRTRYSMADIGFYDRRK